MSSSQPQFCAICDWRETCAKKFCVADGGARCPDFTRDVSIRPEPSQEPEEAGKEQQP